MRIFEVMSEHVRTVPSTLGAAEAWGAMQTAGIHHLVVKDGSSVVGIVSEADLGGPHGAAIRAGRDVAHFMQRRFAAVEPDETVRKAANLMAGRGIGCLPVMQRGRLRGVVTISDMLALLGRGVDRPLHEQRPIANHRVPHRRAAVATGRW